MATAQQHGYYFTEKTKGESGKFGQSGMIYGETATTSAVLSNTAYKLVSYPFGYRSSSLTVPRNHMCGKKFLAGMEVTVAYDDVVAILDVEGSWDGTNWWTLTSAGAGIVADTTPNVAEVKMGLVDLTDIYVPYIRLAFNSSGLECGTSGTAKFFYCLPHQSI